MISHLVFPQDTSQEEIAELQRIFLDAGFSDAESEWLVHVFRRTDCFGDPTGKTVFDDGFVDFFERILPDIVVNVPAKSDRDEKDQTRLALLFSFLLGLGPVYSVVIRPKGRLGKASSEDDQSPESEDGQFWIDAFRSQAKFSANHLNWHFLCKLKDSETNGFRFYDLVPYLLPQGVPLSQVVDIGLLDPKPKPGCSSADFKDPNQLEFWLIWRFRADEKRCGIVNLSTLIPAFLDLHDPALGDKLLGLANAIRDALNIGTSGTKSWDPENKGWRLVAGELIPFLELLETRIPESLPVRRSLLKAWWSFSVSVYGWHKAGLESELSDARKNRLVESAVKHIGLLRAMLRDEPDSFEDIDATEGPVSAFYEQAVQVLLCFAEPWKCLKPLLLAFSTMNKQAVTIDLRAWPETGLDSPPHPFSLIPMWITRAMYPQNLTGELKRDPNLRDLREMFADFCLERLKSKKTGKSGAQKTFSSGAGDKTHNGFLEKRPVWRRCYVQALSALRVNPGGRAHRTLFWLANNDPDESVREFASKAHKQIRHLDRTKSNLDVGASPRRPLFEAFWWFRQAHLLTLGIEIDQAGAQRTHRKELHRTREKDDRRTWES